MIVLACIINLIRLLFDHDVYLSLFFFLIPPNWGGATIRSVLIRMEHAGTANFKPSTHVGLLRATSIRGNNIACMSFLSDVSKVL